MVIAAQDNKDQILKKKKKKKKKKGETERYEKKLNFYLFSFFFWLSRERA
jgi:hypothetical protein